MCPATTSTAMPSGNLHPVTMTLRSEPSELSETMRSSLRSRRNRRPTVAVSSDARCGDCFCGLTICLFTRFVSAPSSSIVGRAADDVDVVGNSDSKSWLSAVTPSNLDPRPFDQGPLLGQAEELRAVAAEPGRGDEQIPPPCRHRRLRTLRQFDLRQEIR